MHENYPYTSIRVSPVRLPYRTEPYLQAEFTDPQLSGYRAILVADTQDLHQGRLATMITRFPRKILSEMNTHRVFSRNSASTRARSVKSVVESVLNDPYVPRFTKNQKGMSGTFVSASEQQELEELWLEGRDLNLRLYMRLLMGQKYDPTCTIDELIDQYQQAYRAHDTDGMFSIHKQDVNHVLTPYMWHEAIITSSFWENFFSLRMDLSQADPAIYAIALLMNAVLEASSPQDSLVHLPFISEGSQLSGYEPLEEVRSTLMLAATEAAQISYHDKSTASRSTARAELGERLLQSRHLSPFEHIAYRADAPAVKHLPSELSGNLSQDWRQLRRIYG